MKKNIYELDWKPTNLREAIEFALCFTKAAPLSREEMIVDFLKQKFIDGIARGMTPLQLWSEITREELK